MAIVELPRSFVIKSTTLGKNFPLFITKQTNHCTLSNLSEIFLELFSYCIRVLSMWCYDDVSTAFCLVLTPLAIWRNDPSSKINFSHPNPSPCNYLFCFVSTFLRTWHFWKCLHKSIVKESIGPCYGCLYLLYCLSSTFK